MSPSTDSFEEIESAVVRFAGDSGDGDKDRPVHHRHAPLCDGPVSGPRHPGVDLEVDQVVERRGGTRHEGNANRAEQQYFPVDHAIGCQKHAHDRTQEHEQHHAGFAHFEVVAPGGGAVCR